MIRTCGYPGCDTTIVICHAEVDTNRCYLHKGLRGEGETDEVKIDRVCTLFGWQRRRPK